MSGVIAFYVNHGVEARHYVLSTFTARLEKFGFKVVFLFNNEIDSEYRRSFFPENQTIILPKKVKRKSRNKIEGYVSAIRKARMNLKNVGLFHNFNDPKPPSFFRDFILGNVLVHHTISSIARLIYKNHYYDKDTCLFLKSIEIKEIYLLDYNDPTQLQLAFNANEIGIKVNVLVNTLKSFYINNFVPFQANKLFVWSSVQEKLFNQFNPHLKRNCTVASGAFFHHYLLHENIANEEISEEIKSICQKPYVLYSLIFETMYPNEYRLIENLEKTLRILFPDTTINIVIRRNPFETSKFDLNRIKAIPNVLIAPHSWERDENKSWSIQSRKGEMEWKYLLKNAKILINISSMASIESLLVGTPVINLGLNENGTEEVLLKRFYNAPFMKEVLTSKFAGLVLNQNDLEDRLKEFISVKERHTIQDFRDSLALSKTDLTTLDYFSQNK